MHNKYKISLIILFLFALGLFIPGTGNQGNIANAQPIVADSVADDELAYLDPEGYVNIVDPGSSSSIPFYRSTSGDYFDMVALDTNGDGVDELLVIQAYTARLLVPFDTGGALPQFERTSTDLFYSSVSAGDFIPGDGGRDEIVLQSSNGTDYNVKIYDGNADGTSWTLVYDETFGGMWTRMKGGDVDGYEGDELVLLRNVDHRIRILHYDIGSHNWQLLVSKTYGFPWIDLELGNTHVNNGPIDEIITTRSGVNADLPSFLIFQYYNGDLAGAPDGKSTYYPYFRDVAVGDINASGVDEVFMIRDPGDPARTSLLGRSWGTEYIPEWKLKLGRDLKAIAMGDVDGDGKDEIVIAQSQSYRVYWSPDVDYNNSGDIPIRLRLVNDDPFRPPAVIQLGDFDGTAVQPPKMSVAPLSLGFSMIHGAPPPPSQFFQVSNIGGGIINVHVDTRSDWLEVTPFDATAPASFTVRPKSIVSSMVEGVYDATISVSGTSPNGQVINGEQTVSVRLTIHPPGAVLEVSPNQYDFDVNLGDTPPTPEPLTIRNTGNSNSIPYRIDVTTADGGNWLQLSRYSGNTDDTVPVTLDISNLHPGDYTALITVTADDAVSGSPAAIPVTLHIEGPRMIVTPSAFDLLAFKGQPSPTGEVMIKPAQGDGPIQWHAYVLPSDERWWDDIASLYESGQLQVQRTDDGLVFSSPNGETHAAQYISWMQLSQESGTATEAAPSEITASLDMNQVPVGTSHVTILIDGGPDAMDRFQGVDVRVVVAAEGSTVWVPIFLSGSASSR